MPKDDAPANTAAESRTADGTDDTLAASASAVSTSIELTVVERTHYQMLGEFGRGGLGRVLRARDRRTGRIVAIKEALRTSPGLLTRFAREAIVTANLQHPAIVPVYEVGRWRDGDPFYAMKLVAGRSLADAASTAKTVRERLALLPHLIAVADALAYAHAEKVIHRDLKPSNVLIGDYGETVVIDWGLAKRLGDADKDDPLAAPAAEPEPANSGHTVVGSVLGTPGYMAPEQARGELADERSDVYAVGAMLYEVLSRARPYSESTDPSEVITRSRVEAPKPLGELAAEIPRELVAIVDRAMAFAPGDRYPTAKELAEDLKRFTTGQLVGAHQYSAWMLFRRWLRKYRGIVAASAIALVVLAVVGAISVRKIRTARDQAVDAKQRAIAARAVAEDRAAALAEEQGRRLALAGDAPRALPYLAEAVAAGRHSPALEFVLARALDDVAPIEAVLVGSKAPITSIGYSPDGTRLLSSDADGVLRMWDPTAHRLLGTFGTAFAAGWSPDGHFIATVAPTAITILEPAGTVRAKVALTGSPITTLEITPDSQTIVVGFASGRLLAVRPTGAVLFDNHVHTAAIQHIALSPDGALVAAASADKRVSVWKLDGTQLALLDHADKLRDVRFAPSGKQLATADQSGNVATWDVASHKRLVSFVGHTNSAESVRFDRAGTHLLTASSDSTAILWDAATGAKLVTLPVGNNASIAEFAPDGHTIVVATDRGDITVWTLDGTLLRNLSGHSASIFDVAFSPDGTQLASGSEDSDVRLWSLDAPPPLITLQNAGTMSWRGEWAPDGKRFAVTGKDGIARIYDGASGALLHELRGHTGEVTRVAFSPDSTRIATASVDGSARVWSASDGTQQLVLAAGPTRVRFVAFSHDGTRIATTHDDGTALLWEAATGHRLATLHPTRGNPRVALWSPDDTRVLTPLDGDGATLWDASGRVLGEAVVGGEFVPGAAWSPDGATFALGGSTPTGAVFDGKTATLVRTLAGHTLGPITAVDFAADGRIVTSAKDGVARLWRGDTSEKLFGDGVHAMSNVTFRPDGNLVATSDSDVRIWDTTSGELVGQVLGPRDVTNGAFTEAKWSPDGTQLLLLSLGLPPRLWHVPGWHGATDVLSRRLACTERWKLEQSLLVLTTPDPSACH